MGIVFEVLLYEEKDLCAAGEGGGGGRVALQVEGATWVRVPRTVAVE